MHLYTPLISFNWTMLMIWATVIVLFFILKKNFFEKVRNFIAARETEVKDAYSNADLTNKQADERLEHYNKKLSKSENEAREIVRIAKVKADEMAKKIIEKQIEIDGQSEIIDKIIEQAGTSQWQN